MIPEHLTLEGLYSYQERTTIDFRPLTAAQLFGIFGPVGSGKSSILEAITLALYGESARLSRNDRRGLNMLNLRSDRLSVDYTFRLTEGDRFRFTATVKRKNGHPDQVGSFDRRAYRYDERAEEWVPLDHNSGERVVGLSYENFRRTTIIPQGQFQEFLQLGSSDRTVMMKELFQLERFDLYRRTRSLADAADRRLEGVRSALAEIPDGLEEQRRDLEQERRSGAQRRDAIAEELTGARSRVQLLERAEALQREAATLEVERAGLDADEEQRRGLEQRIALLEVVRDRLKDPFEAMRSTADRREAAWRRVEEIENARKPVRERLAAVVRRRAELAERDAERTSLEARDHALEIAERLEPIQQEITHQEHALADLRATKTRSVEQAETFETRIASLSAGLPDRSRLPEIQRLVEAELARIAARERIARRRTEVLRSVDLHDEDHPADVLRRTIDATKEQREALLAQRHERLLEGHLAALAGSLEEGKPCPLCGSPHHPHPVHDRSDDDGDDVGRSGDDGADDDTLAAVETRLTELQRVATTLVALGDEEDALDAEAIGGEGATDATGPTNTTDATGPTNASNAFGATFQAIAGGDVPADPREAGRMVERAWGAYTQIDAQKEALERVRGEVARAEQALAAAEARLAERKTQRDAVEAELQPAMTAMSEEDRTAVVHAMTNDIAGARRRIGERLSELERMQRDLEEEARAAEAQDQRLDAQEHERREIFQGASAEHDDAARAFQTAVDGTLADIRDRTGGIVGRPQAQHDAPDPGVARAGMPDDGRPSTEAIAAWIDEVPRLREYQERLTRARERYNEVAARISAITVELGGMELPSDVERERRTLQERVAALDAEARTIDTRLGEVSERLHGIAERIRRRDQLAAEEADIAARRDNLSTLVNLFRGSAFVAYVAQVYLEQLVMVANRRFRRLTRNHLELTLSGQSDFAVIDHLNGGRRRSVKTLSGGQTFQAALCLAIALVDSIDRKSGDASASQAGPGFFFLDEGFGSLDADALRDVFDTLKDLRRENRIIGVISHVEAMRQEIDAGLVIERDEDRGSRVSFL